MDVPVVVVADDTDILIMLLHFSDYCKGEFIMLREGKGQTGVRLLIRVKDIVARLERSVLENILPIHAWGGCVMCFIRQSES